MDHVRLLAASLKRLVRHRRGVHDLLTGPYVLQYYHGLEPLHRYQPGGYHPVSLNELMHNRYRIIDKLGFGGYSTIWLARDELLARYVAVKIGTSCSSRPSLESAILHDLSTPTSTPYKLPLGITSTDLTQVVLDDFHIEGPNGTHRCFVVHPAQGSLTQAQGYGSLFPLVVARALAARLILAIATMHAKGYVHGDLTLSNVLVGLSENQDHLSVEEFRRVHGEPEVQPVLSRDGKLLPPNYPSQAVCPMPLCKDAENFVMADVHGTYLSDFGEAFAPDTNPRLGKDSHIPVPMRAPEALFEPQRPLSYASDIWSLGTAIWHILSMKYIFSKEEYDRDEVVAEQLDVLGSSDFPPSWSKLWNRTGAVVPEASHLPRVPRIPTFERDPWPPLEEAFIEFILDYRRGDPAFGVPDSSEIEAFLSLMRAMLRFHPESRLTIEEVLRSEWVTKWALPALKSS